MKTRALVAKLASSPLHGLLQGSVGHSIGLAIWILVMAGLVVLGLGGVPDAYRAIAAFEGQTAPAQALVRQGLAELGIPEGLYVFVVFARYLFVGLGFFGAGAFIFWQKPRRPEVLLFTSQLVMFGLFALIPQNEGPPDQPALAFIANLSFAAVFFIFFLFPDGRFVPAWSRWIVVAWIFLVAAVSLFEGSVVDPNTWPPLLSAPLWLVMFLSGPAAILYRYKRRADALQKRQLRWVAGGSTITAACFLAYWLPIGIVPALTSLPSNAAMVDLVGGTAQYLALLFIPLSITFSVMRLRLWDIEPLVSRTLVWGSLALCVVGIYVAVVGYFSYFLQVRSSQIVSIMATAIVAVTFQPIHARLQRKVNRLLYGLRDDPYQALTRLGHHLEMSTSADEMLTAIVTTIGEALRFPYVALAVWEDGELAIRASTGQAREAEERLPIAYLSEHLGELIFSGRSGDEKLSALDRRLLGDLLQQAGVALKVVNSTRQLRCMNRELQQARVQLVTAREEERRRLGRDLHDDLGSILASINYRAGAIKMQLAHEPGMAEGLINELQEMIRSAIGSIRLIARELRPPVLDEIGLREAIIELAAQFNSSDGSHNSSIESRQFRVIAEVVDPLPDLPAAVEVAAFRIIQEALANAHTHAGGGLCRLSVCDWQSTLRIEINDDGIGLPDPLQPGVGVRSMQERAVELGGKLLMERNCLGGTTVRAYLPIISEDL